MKIPNSGLVANAVAHSIQAISKELECNSRHYKVLNVTYLKPMRIQLGEAGLCFNEKQLIKAVKTGFALPYIFPIFKNPINSISSLITLLKIKSKVSSGSVPNQLHTS